ncbi:MAG: DEAD/DEAH box helicase [Halobacteriales archaeon]
MKLSSRETAVVVEPTEDGFSVVFSAGSETLFVGDLEVGDRPQGPRPVGFELGRPDGELETRAPSDFVELAREADRVVVPDHASARGVSEIERLLEGYQLDLEVESVCRFCLLEDRYTRLDGGVRLGEERVCLDCGLRELGREARHAGLSRDAVGRLERLLREVGDVDDVVELLGGSLDPELTRFDRVPASDAPKEIRVEDLGLDPRLEGAVDHETLLPVQAAAVDAGLLEGDDLLVVSATATGKTLVGELAGLQAVLEGGGRMLYLAPLVALSNQKYRRFRGRYPFVDVTRRIGSNRLTGSSAAYDADADVVVATYEGVDHMLRRGESLGDVAVVVVDEVHNVYDGERGPRLDGMLARLGHEAPDAQYVYLSATVAAPGRLAESLDASLVVHEGRPVPLERHLTFASRLEKKGLLSRLVARESQVESSKGYRGQSIVFTNSRRRCHSLADSLDDAVAYHAGLSGRRRQRIEDDFEDGVYSAVVTTAALGAGVDFPASQVVFERLAMGIEWLSPQEFEQMAGRAGRPDYHDRGVVYVLAEPDAVYHSSMKKTEDEVAVELLRGEFEGEDVVFDAGQMAEQCLANAVYLGETGVLDDALIGDVDTESAVDLLNEEWLMRDDEVTGLGVVAAEGFVPPGEAGLCARSIEAGMSPMEVVAELEVDDEF